MKASRTKLAQVIAEQTIKGKNSQRLPKQIAAYLLSTRRVGELESLLRDIQLDWARLGRVEVEATSAFKLSNQVKSDIRSKAKKLYPNAKSITISEIYDPSVVGGVNVTIANQQLDLTLETKLNRFKHLALTGKDF